MSRISGRRGAGRAALALALALSTSGCSRPERHDGGDVLQQEVMDAEWNFARTMAARDHDAFTSFLSDEAIFISGSGPLRGKTEVAEGWRRYFGTAEAPFSWKPERVEVLRSGSLALSTGPVYDPDGRRIATFTSIWRKEAGGEWRIIFDRGTADCQPDPTPGRTPSAQ